MAYNLKSESDVKQYLHNLSIEYRFGCYSEKNPEVCHLLGDYLESIDKDFSKAGRVYKSNCDDYKYAKSCYKYGAYNLVGRGLSKPNYKESYKYFDQGCNLNNAESCLHQGLLLVSNNAESGIEADVLKGMALLAKSCDTGNANACYYLSGMYISGVRKPELKATKSFEKIPEDSYAVKKDMEKAFKYTLDGCNLGNIYSCANLSQMYARGEGTEKNEELALKYRKIALEMQEELRGNQPTLKFGQGLSNS